jgi:hypothetical protein
MIESLRNSHINQAVPIGHTIVIEPGTVAGFPFLATHHAELSLTAARHMVAAFLKLNHSMAAIAGLPAAFLSFLHKLLYLWVLRTFARPVHFRVANDTYFRFAPRAFCKLSSLIMMDLARSDPSATFRRRTVDPVLGVVFLITTVPSDFEFGVKEFVHMLQGDVLTRAALGRHVSRIFDRHFEYTSQAVMAHSMATTKSGSLYRGNIIRTTCEAFDQARWCWYSTRGIAAHERAKKG